MGLQSALSTALTGLNAAETIIDVAGNNVANSQTVGFKESGVNFATQFLQTISIGAAPSAGNGGTNPRQIGLGVKVAEISQDFTQGTIEISSNPLDVAIQGDGFLIVEGGQGEDLYTRNGQLKTNQNNEVITTTGNRVLGYNAVNGVIVENLEPLVIPIGGSVVNKVTSTASFSGTLSPTSAVGVASIIESGVFSDNAMAVPAAFPPGSFGATPPIDVSATSGALSATPSTNIGAGTYLYRVTFVDTEGNETPGSEPISVNISTPGDIQLSNLPTSSGDYVGRNIYRTHVGGTGDYYKVNATLLNATDTTFPDSATDASLTVPNDDIDDALEVGGVYSYYVTFYRSSDGEETRPTALQGPITINSPNQRIRIDNIPQPDTLALSQGFSQIRIYRSLSDDSSSHHQLVTLTPPPAQTTYMDSVSDATIEARPVIDLDGPWITPATLLTDLIQRSGPDYAPVFSGPGTLTLEALRGGKALPAKTFEITATSTVQDYRNFLQEAMGINMSVPDAPTVVVSNGKMQVESNKGLTNALSIGPSSITFVPTATGQSETKNFGFDTIQQATGEGTTSEFVVYDSLGIPLTVQLTTVLEEKRDSSTVWRWFATSGDHEPLSGASTIVGTGTVTYDDNGVLDLANSGNLTVVIERNATASESPLDFDLNFTQTNGKGNGTSRLNFTTQDGFPPGVLTDFSITETGEIRGVYSNGIGQTLGQIVMARFTNNNGLQQVGNNMYTIGVNSGSPQYGIPGDAGLGSLTAGAVELSNTDIGQNLIELILASTQYRGGARVITAVQELLDELMALQR